MPTDETHALSEVTSNIDEATEIFFTRIIPVQKELQPDEAEEQLKMLAVTTLRPEYVLRVSALEDLRENLVGMISRWHTEGKIYQYIVQNKASFSEEMEKWATFRTLSSRRGREYRAVTVIRVCSGLIEDWG